MYHLMSNEQWRGTAWGISVSMVDICSSILLFCLAINPKCKLKLLPPGAFFYLLYFLTTLVSGMDAMYVEPWSFEICKMVWMYVAFIAMYNYLNTYPEDLVIIARTFCGILLFLMFHGFYQKYFTGIYPMHCTFPHQNSLSMYLEVMGMFILSFILNARTTAFQRFICLTAFTFAILLMVLTLSRGGMMFFGMGSVVVVLASLILNRSIKQVSVFCTACVIAGTPLVLALTPRIIDRFENAPKKSTDGRVFLAIAACRIANDHLLGVGANQFSEYSSVRWDYAREQHAMEKKSSNQLTSKEMGSVVETIYLLVAAECGWGGFACLLLWMYYYFFHAFALLFRLRRGPYFCYALGAFCALLCNYVQSAFEWVLKQYCNFYIEVCVMAIIAYLWTHRKEMAQQKGQYATL